MPDPTVERLEGFSTEGEAYPGVASQCFAIRPICYADYRAGLVAGAGRQ
jgi:hypothetical protein